MKRIAAIAVIGGLLVAGSAWAAQVTNVEISYQDGFTVARIDVQGQVRFTHQTEIPKDGRPDRMIVDILAATHALGDKEFLELPPCIITGIRSSQFAVSPEKITRVVFDLNAAPVYRVESDDKSVTVYFSEKEARSFLTWSSSGKSSQEKPDQPVILAEKPASAVTPTLTEKSVQARNEAIEQDRKASLTDTPKPVPPLPTPGQDVWARAESGDRGVDSRMFSDDLGYAPVIKDMPEPSPMEEEYGKATEKTPAVTESAQPAKPASIPEPINEVEVAAEVSAPQLTVAEKAVDEKTETVKAEPTSQPEEIKPGDVPSMTWCPPMALLEGTQVETAEVPATPSTAEPTKPTATTSEEAKPESTEPVVAVTETPVAAGTPEAAPTEHVDTIEVSPSDFEPAVETEGELGDESIEPAPGAARATARFRREAQSDKIRGTMVAEFPERLVIKYEQAGNRDPFSSLIDVDRTFDAPVENRIPNVEGLKLVGIIDSDGGQNQALFEDKTGFSYILKTGDKVRNGYVLRVEPEQVYFQIFEYGWSRTVALTME